MSPNHEVDLSHPISNDRGRDRRIEKWLDQQCSGIGSSTWQHEEDKLAELQSTTEERFQPQHTTCNSVTTPDTSASFSWDTDPLLSISASPVTPLASPVAPSQGPCSSSKSQLQLPSREHPETEAARADSPLLGFSDLEGDITAPTSLLGTLLEGNNSLNTIDLGKVFVDFFLITSRRFSDRFSAFAMSIQCSDVGDRRRHYAMPD